MKKTLPLLLVIIALAFVILGRRTASSQDKQDKYSLKVPGGLAFSDFCSLMPPSASFQQRPAAQ